MRVLLSAQDKRAEEMTAEEVVAAKAAAAGKAAKHQLHAPAAAIYCREKRMQLDEADVRKRPYCGAISRTCTREKCGPYLSCVELPKLSVVCCILKTQTQSASCAP